MLVLQNVLSFLEGLSTGDGLKAIGAGLAVFTGFAAAIGEGNVAAHAVDAMARQPEMAGTIRTTMLIGQAVSETTGLYGLIIAILLVM
ncbi:MAG: ATP synthase F0 subunit C [Acholeplasmatales bacterium]|nr:ATP synthase F0 subunit C [Acholeplasmatales bacterium]